MKTGYYTSDQQSYVFIEQEGGPNLFVEYSRKRLGFLIDH